MNHLKLCARCQQEKELHLFHKANCSRTKDGHASWCKECTAGYNLQKNLSYRGVLQKMLCNMRLRSKRKGHELSITLDELVIWAESVGYAALYHAWEQSGYCQDLRPVPDRKDALKPYTLCNMTLMTYTSNVLKSHTEVKTNHKSVYGYKDGVLMHTFTSVAEASKQTGITSSNISRCASGTRQSAGGFVWTYIKLSKPLGEPNVSN